MQITHRNRWALNLMCLERKLEIQHFVQPPRNFYVAKGNPSFPRGKSYVRHMGEFLEILVC